MQIKLLKLSNYKLKLQWKLEIIKSKWPLLKSPEKSYLWLTKVLNESVKSIKKVLQELKSPWKSPPAENPHHAEASQSICNASKLADCNKTRSQNQGRPQNRPEYHKYLLFSNITQWH